MEKPHKKLDILKKSTPASRLPTLLILLIIIPAALCLYLYAADFRAAGLFHDDGIYLVNAKSIYEGAGYRTLSLPDSPPQTKYPPLYPLILSLLWRFNPSFPNNIHLMRIFSSLCAVFVLFLAWSYLKLKSNCKTLILLLFLSALAFNAYFALFAGEIMSEMPFTLFSLASIVLFLHYERQGKKASLFGAFLLAVIAFYTRTIGVALFFSFVLWFFYQRHFKAAFLLSGITIATVLPWFYWVSINAPAVDSLVGAYYSSYSSWFLLANQSILRDAYFFVKQFTSISLFTPLLLCPLKVNLPSLIFDTFFWFFLLVGMLNQLKKSPSVDIFYLITTVAIVAVWLPGGATRFLLPVLPIVLFCLMDGTITAKEDLAALSHRLQNLVRPLWLMGVAVLLAGIFAFGILRTPASIRETITKREPLLMSMEEACEWIGDNTKKSDTIASHLDPLVYLLSGRQAVNIAWRNYTASLQDPEKIYSEDHILGAFKKYRISYLLLVYSEQSLEDKIRKKKLSEIIMKYPDAFHLMHKKEGLFAIYKVKPQALGN
jgi:hypothetical protein